MKLTILCYDKCSTCKKALDWLDKKGIAYEKRPIREQNPTTVSYTHLTLPTTG